MPAIMTAVRPRAGATYVVGLIGPPGAGRSTVADRLTGMDGRLDPYSAGPGMLGLRPRPGAQP